MAKRSKSQTELTINQIKDEAFKQIIEIGFDNMSYTTLSQATGISRTGISHHFPKKTDFLVKLDDRIAELFVGALDFTSINSLEASWFKSFDEPESKAVLSLFFRLCGNEYSSISQFQAIENSLEEAKKKLGEEGEKLLKFLIGSAAVSLLSY
ncbi:TetR/AcrR family transcriptional regulator [Parashewanella curva]|uniref:TetR/AcrR family transcriptional regulator n=1 Tax=Parashewanella curva TaxID=2338552 RepID=A0A3L8Q3D4_9GAMM|nr:TetR family transcriptional regulator [Parashewanella curva]RLV61719.1 TetR/AcrR family transcriptional regulator [Parashewanella curva]